MKFLFGNYVVTQSKNGYITLANGQILFKGDTRDYNYVIMNLYKNKELKFFKNVEKWATDRGILKNGDYFTQKLKLIEEFGELAGAIAKNDFNGIKDAIGDMAVVFTIMTLLEEDNFPRHSMISLTEVMPVDEIIEDLRHNLTHPNLLSFLRDISEKLLIPFDECLETAWEQIKDRKGYLNENGVFVKEV